MNGSAYLDTRSVLVVAVAMAALMGMVSLVFARVERATRALRLWGWSLLIFAVGIALVALRGQVPGSAGIIIADTVLFAAAIPTLRSVRSFNAEPTADVPGWLIAVLGFVLISFWTLVTPDQVARIAAFSAILALQYFRISSYLVRTLPKRGRLPQAFTAAVIAVFSASSAVRAVLTLREGTIEDYFAPSNLQSVSFLGYTVFFVAATLGVMWMEIQRLESDLVRLATIDGLTGILNRRAFLDASEREISRCNRSGETFGFAMFDLDLFKRINDSYGHQVGDRMLRLFTDTLRSVLRSHDFLGRYGGEEFALVMPGIDKTAACAIVERCRQAVERRSIEHDGRPIKLTVSAGVAAFGEDGSDLETLIKAADAALYQAKASGRNRIAAAPGKDLIRNIASARMQG
jgi:diguanylate cyclase (GGDEF)-like protein